MSQSHPYQPLLFRVLHGAIAGLVLAALITAVLIYNMYDGRFGHLPLPPIPKIMGIHKLFGRLFLFGLPVFVAYSFHVGGRRLLQANSLEKLTYVGKPIWWYTLHRLVNTLLLIASVFALVSGRQIHSGWLTSRDLLQPWYSLHLSSWVVIVLCIIAHISMVIKVGGFPLLWSMISLKQRPNDRLVYWLMTVKIWIRQTWLSKS